MVVKFVDTIIHDKTATFLINKDTKEVSALFSALFLYLSGSKDHVSCSYSFLETTLTIW